MTIDQLILILQRAKMELGDHSVMVSDPDTSLAMEIYEVRSWRGHVMLHPEGYTDEVRGQYDDGDGPFAGVCGDDPENIVWLTESGS